MWSALVKIPQSSISKKLFYDFHCSNRFYGVESVFYRVCPFWNWCFSFVQFTSKIQQMQHGLKMSGDVGYFYSNSSLLLQVCDVIEPRRSKASTEWHLHQPTSPTKLQVKGLSFGNFLFFSHFKMSHKNNNLILFFWQHTCFRIELVMIPKLSQTVSETELKQSIKKNKEMGGKKNKIQFKLLFHTLGFLQQQDFVLDWCLDKDVWMKNTTEVLQSTFSGWK